jgi:hypothetical protein
VTWTIPLVDKTIAFGSVSLDGLDSSAAVPTRLTISWSGLSVPAAAVLSGDALAAAVGAGYEKFSGDGQLSWSFNAQARDLEIESSGSFAKTGAWDFALSFANVSPALFQPSVMRKTGAADDDLFSSLAGSGLEALATMQLKSVSGSLDLSSVIQRSREIPNTDMPVDDQALLFEIAPQQLSRSLIEAGMSPPDARDTSVALQRFAATGTRIRLKSRIDHPVPLFGNGSLLKPLFLNLPAFLAATNTSLSI